MNIADDITETELRNAFKQSGLWRDGWTYAKAIGTSCTRIGLLIGVKAMRAKYQQQHGKPAPVQQALI